MSWKDRIRVTFAEDLNRQRTEAKTTAELTQYLDKILEDPYFNACPVMFLLAWKKKRGRTESMRYPEDHVTPHLKKLLGMINYVEAVDGYDAGEAYRPCEIVAPATVEAEFVALGRPDLRARWNSIIEDKLYHLCPVLYTQDWTERYPDSILGCVLKKINGITAYEEIVCKEPPFFEKQWTPLKDEVDNWIQSHCQELSDRQRHAVEKEIRNMDRRGGYSLWLASTQEKVQELNTLLATVSKYFEQ